jgi:undecaprenyl diphosphate synthase
VQEANEGTLKPAEVTEESFNAKLKFANLPDPDVLIRTSGEYRISNFLIWQIAYSEMFFVDKYWPELTKVDLRRIMHSYSERHRRFGK